MTALVVALLLAQLPTPGVVVKDEGAFRGPATTLNCAGAGISCSVAGGTATLSVAGGGGGTPGGANTQLQFNDGGVFGAGNLTFDKTTDALVLGSIGTVPSLSLTTSSGIPVVNGSLVAGLQFNSNGRSDLGWTTGIIFNAQREWIGALSGNAPFRFQNFSTDFFGIKPTTGNGAKLVTAGSMELAGSTVTLTGTLQGAPINVGNLNFTGTPSATTFPRGDGTWSEPAGTYALPTASGAVLGGIKVGTSLTIAAGVLDYTNPNPTPYTLPAASTTLGGVKSAAACAAGSHYSSIGAGGELGCTADAGGGGADALGRYLVQTATNAPANAQVMGLLSTGLVKNTTTTGVQSTATSGTDYGPPTSANATGLVISTTATGAHTAYAGTSCTNQYPRSLNASGAATCASVDLSTDTAATVLPMTKGGTGANLTGTVGGVRYSTSTTVTGQTAGGAAGTILINATANTPAWLAAGAAGEVLRSAGAASPVYVAVQTCTSSASTTCTITVARSGCRPVCGLGTAASTWVKGTVATTTLTCTFSTSGTNTCNCFCP